MAAPLRIDLHTHILPESWPDLEARYGYGGFVRMEHTGPCHARLMVDDRVFREVNDNCWNPSTRLAECDEAGVTVQVLSTVPIMFSYWARARDTADLARLLNDHLAGVVAGRPDRFVGLGTVPMQDADLAARELERCVRELGMPGVQIGTHVNGVNLDAPEIFPFFEAAAQLGAAVFIHPWDMLAPERMQQHWLGWLVGMPTETCLAVCSLLLGGVLERLPGLRVCFAHGGGSFPGTIGRIEHGYHARPDLCARQATLSPRQQLGRFWVDSLVHDPMLLRQLVELVGIRRVVLGSDYPFPLGEEHPGAVIEQLADLSPSDRERLWCRNALEFLSLDESAFRR